MEQHALKNVNTCLNTNIYSNLETSGGQSCNLCLNVVHFLTPMLIRHLWQLKTVVFLHWYLHVLCDWSLFVHHPYCFLENQRHMYSLNLEQLTGAISQATDLLIIWP
jgi:hypothetical protein